MVLKRSFKEKSKERGGEAGPLPDGGSGI